jgi:hypothetical protein
VTGVTEASLSYTLATGESVTLTADADTMVAALGEGTTFRRFRVNVDEIELAEIAAGSEVVAWSVGQEDGSFVAQRIMVLPSETASDDAGTTDVTASPAADA